jgi:hypothetical protein
VSSAGGIGFQAQGPGKASTPVKALRFLFVTKEPKVITAFLLGVIAYQIRHQIPHSRFFFITFCSVMLILPSLLTQEQGAHVAFERFFYRHQFT